MQMQYPDSFSHFEIPTIGQAFCMKVNILYKLYMYTFHLALYYNSIQAKKDIDCLDSPGLIRVWCSNSNMNDNISCFTSLSNQGVINTPNLVII